MSKQINVLDHGFVRLVDHMGSDLSIVRAARVSYDAAWRAGENEGSDKKLIDYLWKNRHTTPFEAVEFQFEVMAPIFVLRQWHRHRTWCLTGDTLVTFELPDRIRQGRRTAKRVRLDDLYRKWQPSVRKARPERQTNPYFSRTRIKNMLLRVYDEQNEEFTIGHIGDVVQSGVKTVFEITLADGKRLKCSKDHLLLTTDGWRRLEDAVGLVVVGATAGMTRKASILTNGYVEGQTPWNKGVRGYKTSRVVTDAEKEVIRAARSGEKSNFWKGGTASDRAGIARWTREQAPRVHAASDYTCQDCGQRGSRLHAHHIKSVVEFPELAREFSNLVTLCSACHALRHGRTGDRAQCRARGQTLRAKAFEIVSISLVGEEMTYDLSVEGPHHNFVANGMIVHNSYNELSGRYRELPENYYLPDPANIGEQAVANKQGRQPGGDLEARRAEVEKLRAGFEAAFATYRELLAAGWPRELARTVLPLSTYSHMFAKVNLLNLFKFLSLRADGHAQYEIRVYAEAMETLVEPIVPVAVAAWKSSRL
jgi:thymidylate synthase (FAD)